MPPALRIPVALDLNSLKDQTKQASDRVGETLKGIGRAFQQVNGEMLGIARDTAGGVALGWSQSLAATALRFALLGTTAVVAFKGISAAIDETREQLARMVDIADKSRDALVSPQFFQSWLTESNKLKVSADDLEGALKQAFSATKEQSPIDLAKWETGEEKITDVEKALRVYNETVAKAAGQRLEGLVLFRDATNQEGKVVAVLQAMIQLNSIGQNLASLDLGEKMFGAQFVDRIRQGRTSAEEMLVSIKSASAASAGFFPNELVRRAKEVDDQLKQAQQTLSRELKPTWESLASTMLTIKSLWAEVVGLMAQAASIANSVGIGSKNQSELAAKQAQLANANKVLEGGPAFFGFEQKAREALRDKLQAEVDALLEKQRETARSNRQDVTTTRGTGAAPTLKKDETADPRTRFDAAADSVEKRTASLQAETANIDLNTAARERARVVAELETVAKQANAAAGLGENVVTAEQTQRINEVADAYGRAAEAIDKARYPLQTWLRESQNVEKALSQVAASGLDSLADGIVAVASKTKTLSEAFRQMATSILQDLARIAARKAIAGIFGGGSGGGGDFFSSLFGGGGSTSYAGFNVTGLPGNAAGTDNWRGGPTWVGEQGPEIVNLPKGSQVIPNNIAARSGAGGSPTIVYAPNNTFQGTGGELAEMRKIMDEDRRRVPSVIAAQIANPNSQVSKSLKDHTTTQARR